MAVGCLNRTTLGFIVIGVLIIRSINSLCLTSYCNFFSIRPVVTFIKELGGICCYIVSPFIICVNPIQVGIDGSIIATTNLTTFNLNVCVTVNVAILGTTIYRSFDESFVADGNVG